METESSQSDAVDSWSQVDPADIEARLNALASRVESEVSEDAGPQTQSPLDLFLADPSMTQLILRTGLDEGDATTETATSFHRLAFEPGEQRKVLHLAFVPDLCETPSVSAQLIDGNGRIKVTRAARFGVRLEIILPTPSESSRVLVVEATCTANQSPV